MNFEPNEEQATILTALAKLAMPFASVSTEEVVQRHVYAPALQQALIKDGFLDIGVDDPGGISAGLIVAEMAKLPVAVEVTASTLIRPAICPDAEAPLAIIWGAPAKPTRFLPQARTVLLADDQGIRLLHLIAGDVREVSSIYAYPMGQLSADAVARAVLLPNASVERLKTNWRIGIALEIYGALEAAHRLTLEHVKDRQQFGRPLGSFQAIQHRLAIDATMIQSCHWLSLKAAYSLDPADAATAAGYAQECAKIICYDLHQFSGAMGMTLEYSLHLFTYRAQFLQSELGGGARQMAAVADAIWPVLPAHHVVASPIAYSPVSANHGA